MQWALELYDSRYSFGMAAISSKFAVINTYNGTDNRSGIMVIDHQEKWHIQITVPSNYPDKQNRTEFVLQDQSFRVLQLHLQDELLFFALNKSRENRVAFSLHIVKLRLLKKYADSGTLDWQECKERIDWNFEKQYSEQDRSELHVKLSSCNFAWKGPRDDISLVAYAVFLDNWGTSRNMVRILAFEATFGKSAEELVFRQIPSSGPATLPVSNNCAVIEPIAQSSLYFFEGIGKNPSEDKAGDRIAVHIGIDDDGELYVKCLPLILPPGIQRARVYAADTYSGAYIIQHRNGIEIVYP